MPVRLPLWTRTSLNQLSGFAAYLPTCPSISLYPSSYLSMDLPIYASIYLQTCQSQSRILHSLLSSYLTSPLLITIMWGDLALKFRKMVICLGCVLTALSHPHPAHKHSAFCTQVPSLLPNIGLFFCKPCLATRAVTCLHFGSTEKLWEKEAKGTTIFSVHCWSLL